METCEKTKEKLLSNIKEIRKLKGYSQKYIGEKLGHTYTFYNLIESGRNGLEFRVLCQIATVLDMSVVDLILYPNKLDKVEVCENCIKKDKIIDNLNKYIELLQQNGTK